MRTRGRVLSSPLCGRPGLMSLLAVAFRPTRSRRCLTRSNPQRRRLRRPRDVAKGGRTMGLIGGMARTAVVAGTATAVSNRVSRRQGNRWAEKDQQSADAADAEAYRQQQDDQQQGYPPQQAYAPPPQPAAAPAGDDMLTQLQKLGELKTAGVLTEEEFAAQKAKILGS